MTPLGANDLALIKQFLKGYREQFSSLNIAMITVKSKLLYNKKMYVSRNNLLI
jgi:hypothetical protein